MRITVERSIDDTTTEAFLVFYHDAFAPLSTKTAIKQTSTDEEFRELTGAHDVVKFVAVTDEGQPVALALVTTNLKRVPWINLAFYEHRYPAHYDRGAIYYFLTLVVAPDYQDTAVIHAMIEAIALYIGLDKGVIAFDCCEFNVKELAIPEMIAALGGQHVDVITEELDVQRYYGYELFGIKALDLRDRPEHGVTIDITDTARAPHPTVVSGDKP